MSRGKRSSIRKYMLVLLVGIICPLAVGITHYGITERAIIAYWLEAPDSFDPKYKSYMEVKVKFENRGNTDAAVILKISVKNATILNNTIEYPAMLISESMAEFHYAALKNQEGVQVIRIVPKSRTETFVVKVAVEKKFRFSISEALNYIFGEVKGYYPTLIIYKQLNGTRYQKVKQ